MRLLTNHMWQNRWEATYPVAQSAMKSVQVIEVSIRAASAKVRAANIGDFDPATVLGQSPGWQQKDVWSGLVPVYETFGEPVASEVMDGVMKEKETGAGDDLSRIEEWRLWRNEQSKEYAESVAAVTPVERQMKEQVEKWNEA